MLYAYAITRSRRPPAVGGLQGARLRAVSAAGQGVCAIVSEHSRSPLEADVDDLWTHEDVVEAVMSCGAVLPMRVGTAFADEADLARTLSARRQEFRHALARVEDAVELAVRAALDPPSEAPP